MQSARPVGRVYSGVLSMERLHFPSLSGPAAFDQAARLIALAFAVAAVAMAARWLTAWTAPRPVAELAATPMLQPQAGTGAITRLFAPASVQAAAGVDALLLTGVFAGSRGGGFATIRTREGEVHVFRGDEVVPGVTVKDIAGDRVMLSVAGVEKALELASDAAVPAVPPLPGAAAGRAARLPQAPGVPPAATQGAPAIPAQPIQPERE